MDVQREVGQVSFQIRVSLYTHGFWGGQKGTHLSRGQVGQGGRTAWNLQSAV